MTAKAIVCDVEGTTSAISFVHQILFPIAYREMDSFVRMNWKSGFIKDEIEQVQKEVAGTEGPASAVSVDKVIDTLRNWIRTDKKHPALKSVQGRIWRYSFESGHVKGHVYPDVAPNFRKWKNKGIVIAIFSSGSIEAQQLLFQYSEVGDLTPFISHYFDTTTGPKKDPTSYLLICARLGLEPQDILFLSDSVEELDAAAAVGMQTIQLVREEESTPVESTHQRAHSFDDFE
jgi:enolase-phosphatase E1